MKRNQVLELITLIVFIIVCLLSYYNVQYFKVISAVVACFIPILLLIFLIKGELTKKKPLLEVLGFFYKMHFVFTVLFLANSYAGADYFNHIFFILNIAYTILVSVITKELRYAIIPYVYLQTLIFLKIMFFM